MPQASHYSQGASSELDIHRGNLEQYLGNLPDDYYQTHLNNQQPGYVQVGLGIAQGTAGAVESTLNLVPDLAGITRSDGSKLVNFQIVDDRDNGWYQFPRMLTSFGLGWAGVGKVGAVLKAAKGKKFVSSGDEIADLLRATEAAEKTRKMKGLHRGLTWSKFKDISKTSILRGYLADFVAFRGQDEHTLMSLFQKHPELEQTFENMTLQDGEWYMKSAEEIGQELKTHWEHSWDSLKGRSTFAVEGAALGLMFNWIGALGKAGWLRATKQTDKHVLEAGIGGSADALQAARAAERQEVKQASEALGEYDHLSPERGKTLGEQERSSFLLDQKKSLDAAEVAEQEAAVIKQNLDEVTAKEAGEAAPTREYQETYDEAVSPSSVDRELEARAAKLADGGGTSPGKTTRAEGTPIGDQLGHKVFKSARGGEPAKDDVIKQLTDDWNKLNKRHNSLLKAGKTEQAAAIQKEMDAIYKEIAENQPRGQLTRGVDPEPVVEAVPAGTTLINRTVRGAMNLGSNPKGRPGQRQVAEAVKDADIKPGGGASDAGRSGKEAPKKEWEGKEGVDPAPGGHKGKWRETGRPAELPIDPKGGYAYALGTVVYGAGARASYVVIDQHNIRRVFDMWPEGNFYTGKDSILQKEMFNNVREFEEFVIQHNKAKIFFPQLRQEADLHYAARLDQHAIQALKQRGMGRFYKWEFDTPSTLGGGSRTAVETTAEAVWVTGARRLKDQKIDYNKATGLEAQLRKNESDTILHEKTRTRLEVTKRTTKTDEFRSSYIRQTEETEIAEMALKELKESTGRMEKELEDMLSPLFSPREWRYVKDVMAKGDNKAWQVLLRGIKNAKNQQGIENAITTFGRNVSLHGSKRATAAAKSNRDLKHFDINDEHIVLESLRDRFQPKRVTKSTRESLILSEDEQLKIIFGDVEAGRNLVRALREGKIDMNDAMSEAMRILNIDATFTDAGQKYFTARLVTFFTRIGREAWKTQVGHPDPVGHQLAKALGFQGDPNKKLVDDFLREQLMNDLDTLAIANSVDMRTMVTRIREGRGDFKGIHERLISPASGKDGLMDSLQRDTEGIKELYIRTWAYRMDQVASVKRLMGQVDELSKIANPTETQLLNLLEQFEKLNWKTAQFQKLATAEGRALAANKAFKQFGLFDDVQGVAGPTAQAAQRQLAQLKKDILRKAGGSERAHDLAKRLHAIFQHNKHTPDQAATGVRSLLNEHVSGIDIHNEYWLNALLSGTKTAVVNFLGTAQNLFWHPLQHVFGSMGKENQEIRAAFAKQMMYSGMMMAHTTAVFAALGYKAARHAGGAIKPDDYAAWRREFFEKASSSRGANQASMWNQAKQSAAGARQSQRRGAGTLTSESEVFDVTPTRSIRGGDDTMHGAQNTTFFGAEIGRMASKTLDYMGVVVRTPARLMIGTDELFKQITYRSTVMSRLGYEYLLKNPNATKEMLTEHIAANFHGMVRENGRHYSAATIRDEAYGVWNKAAKQAAAENKPMPAGMEGNKDDFIFDYVDKHYNKDRGYIGERAMEEAREVTYTQSLDRDLKDLHEMGLRKRFKSTKAQTVQDAVHKHPGFRLLIQFVRTPINLLRHPFQRLPVGHKRALNAGDDSFWAGVHMKYQADMRSGDPFRRAMAQGRMNTGRMFYGSFLALAMNGKITGAGPTNHRKRMALMATGWRPYSVKVGDYYISYARLDPHSTAVGLAADSYEYSVDLFTDPETNEDIMKSMLMVGQLAFAENVANKSYLAGLTDFMNALTQPDKKAQHFLQTRLASYEPKFVSQFKEWTDPPHIRKAVGYVQALKARTPFLASDVEPYRNVFGEPMLSMHPPTAWAAPFNPFLISKKNNDPVLEWLNSLDYGFSAPTPQIMGVDWLDMRGYKHEETGQTAYDFFQETVGKIKINGLTMRETLLKTMEEDETLNANWVASEWNDNNLLKSVLANDDIRVKKVKQIIAEYREKAAVVTWKSANPRYPKLRNAFLAYVIARDNIDYLITQGRPADVRSMTKTPKGGILSKPLRPNTTAISLLGTQLNYEYN